MDKSLAELREFGVTFARLIANLAVDPHGYFEKKYTARIESSQSQQEIDGVVAHLLRWVDSTAVSDQERTTLDKELLRCGLPSISDMRIQYLP